MCKYCSIIPDIVLERLENKLSIKLKKTNDIALSKSFRQKRSAAQKRNVSFIGAPIGNAKRKIYDSENSTNQRFKLVRKEGDNPVADKDVNTVYDFAKTVREYFINELKWNSIDNHGLDLIFNVHFDLNYNNAFWDGDDMTFGDGDGQYFIGFVNAIDVIGHELTHGVVQYTAKLIYDGQPGALNEHFADVFGTVIKQYHKKQDETTGDWLMGDEIMGSKFAGKAIRSMKDPADVNIPLDPQPAHMDDYYKGSDDNHGVHINSGIPNKAFYLVAMEIGTFSASKLWFAALKNNLGSTSKFIDLYKALDKNVADLVTDGTLPPNTKTVLDDAFRKVGIIK